MKPSLSDARCACGSAEVVAIRVGMEPGHRGAIDLFTRLDPLIERGSPDVFWCRACWPAAKRRAAS